MKRVVGYGLVLLAAGAGAAYVPTAAAADSYFLGAAGSSSGHAAQGYLGVSVRDVSDDQVSVLKLKDGHGAEIVQVDHDAPAGKAGLREHDVVVQLNGQAIEGGDQVRRMLHECAPGKTVVLVVSRDGQLRTFTAQMAASQEEVERQAWGRLLTVPEPQDAPVPSESAATGLTGAPAAAPTLALRGGNSFVATNLMTPAYTGAVLGQMTTQLAHYFGASSGTGLLVQTVVANSPADVAGMMVGDVVVKADARPMVSTNDWAKAIKNSRGKPITVTVLREKKEQTLTLTPDGKRRSSVEQPGDSGETVVAHAGFSWLPRM